MFSRVVKCASSFLSSAGFANLLCRQSSSVSVAEKVIVRHLDGDRKGIVTFLLNNSANKNALGQDILLKLEETILSIHINKSIRALIIGSAVKGVFSSGANLKGRPPWNKDPVVKPGPTFSSIFSQLDNLRIPVIAAIDGYALAGGLKLALACDMIIASDDAKMGLTESKLGIFPGGPGSQRLARVIGQARAKELIFTARLVDGWEAEKIGLVQHCVPQNDNGDAAIFAAVNLAKRCLPNGPFAINMAKTAINKGNQRGSDAAIALDDLSHRSPPKDTKEGIAAFLERRKPVFTGE